MPSLTESPESGVARLAYATMLRCDALAECSEEPGRITRRYLSAPMRTVHERMSEWMTAAGLQPRVDHAGNLIGRRAASPAASGGGEKVLLVGSHLDTVPGGGRYDGVLGVLMGLALAEALGDTPLPFHLDVIGFSEEEGVRFNKPYLGSSAIAGCFQPDWLARTDRSGCTVRDAITQFGGDADRLSEAAYDPATVLGYLEPHLEQGPVLERSGSPVGVVSGIVGQNRLRLEFVGETAHAGTTPMAGRRDALVVAAAFIGEVRAAAERTDDLIATVGKLDVSPNAPNVIADRVEVALDVRHPRDPVRLATISELIATAERLAAAEGCRFELLEDTGQSAVTVDPSLTETLADTIAESGIEPLRLASGAGHDAVVMASRFPVAMLFLRHPGGVSHHPDERVDRDDVAVGIELLTRFVGRLARQNETAKTTSAAR